MNKSFKKLTAIVLAVMLTLSMCVTGLSVSAATTTKTITVGIINYVCNELNGDLSNAQIRYWDASTNGDAKCVSLNKTEQKSVGSSYWSNAAQTFNMYTAEIPANATGYKFHIGNRWFGSDGDTSTSNAVYVFNYSGDKALYETVAVTEPTTSAQTTTAAPVQTTTAAPVVTGTTVKFTDNQGWGTVYAYFWCDEIEEMAGAWPGAAMTSEGDNGYGQVNFSVGIPAGATYVIFTNGSDQTENIQLANFEGYYTDGTRDSEGHLVATGWGEASGSDPVEGTTAAPVQTTTAPVQTTTAAPVVTGTTVKFTDNQGWGTVYAYFWCDEIEEMAGAWPGAAMTSEGDNGYGQVNFSVGIPAGATYVIFTNGSDQTENIQLANFEGYYTDGTRDGEGHLVATGWGEASGSDPVEGTTAASVQTTTAPVQTTTATPVVTGSTVKFTDNQGWGTVYAYFWNAETENMAGAWPGAAMTNEGDNGYGQVNFSVGIPEGATNVIFTNGQDQTENIELANFEGYYTDGTRDSEGHLVAIGWGEASGSDPVEGTTGAPVQTTTATPVVTGSTIKFTDNQGWGTVYAYFWNAETENMAGEWPGAAMTNEGDNGYGQVNFSVGIPEGATNVIFTNGQDQTENIELANFEGYYTDGTRDSEGHLVATGWGEASGSDPVETDPVVTDPVVTDPVVTDPVVTDPVVTDPPTPGSVTLKFAAPTSVASRYNWSNPVFYYGNNGTASTFADNNKIAMTATDEVYYTAEVGTSTIITPGSWKVYSVTLTEEQAAEVDAATVAGFATSDNVNYTRLYGYKVTNAGVDTYTATYSNSASVASLNGYTFVIKDTTRPTGYTTYMGNWVSDFTTVRFAAPASPTAYSTWEDIELYYAGASDTFATSSKIKMVNTYETTKVSDVGDMSKLKAGRWYIYAVSLDPAQTEAVNAAAKVGFSKANAENKTSFAKSVMYAKTDIYDGKYNTTKRTLQELEGQLFVVQAQATATNILTFVGEWQTEAKYTEGKDDTITIRFAAPKGKTAASDWDTGVELYYGNTTAASETTKIAMTKVNMTTAVSVAGTNLATLNSGNWDIYEVELTVAQISAIDHSKNVGFAKAGSYNKTAIRETKSICRASKTEGVTTYSNVSATIEAYDGYTFVINGCLDTANERVSYLGSWVDVK